MPVPDPSRQELIGEQTGTTLENTFPQFKEDVADAVCWRQSQKFLLLSAEDTKKEEVGKEKEPL